MCALFALEILPAGAVKWLSAALRSCITSLNFRNWNPQQLLLSQRLFIYRIQILNHLYDTHGLKILDNFYVAITWVHLNDCLLVALRSWTLVQYTGTEILDSLFTTSNRTRPRWLMQNQVTRELISAWNALHKHNNKDLSRLRQLTWHACKRKVRKLQQRCILGTFEDVPLVEGHHTNTATKI